MTSERARRDGAANSKIQSGRARRLRSISRRPRRGRVIGTSVRTRRSLIIGARRSPIGSNRLGSGLVIAVRLRPGLRAHRLPFLNHDDLRSNRGAIVELDDVVVEQANAAAGNLLADRLRFDRAMKAEVGVLIAAVEVKRARAERIVDAAWQAGRVVRIDRHSANHVTGWRPVRPFGLSADDGVAAK